MNQSYLRKASSLRGGCSARSTRIRLTLGILVFFAMLFHPTLRCAALAATNTKRIAVIGGGASGIFSAVSAAEHYAEQFRSSKGANVEVVVMEATSKTLTKVAISGGGRCNGTTTFSE